MSTSAETGAGPAKGSVANPYEEELQALKRSLEEQRRMTTLLSAEVQKQTEAREALEAQLIEANAEIAASWERRKEMTRVIADRDAKIAERDAKLAVASADPKLIKEVEDLRAEIKASRERRKEISQVVANRDAKIAKLKGELQARYEELATLQRLLVAERSLKGTAKRLVRPITRLIR